MQSGVNALKLSRNVLNYKCKILLYNGLVKSRLDYCAISWADKLTAGQLNRLEVLQKAAVRLIFSAAPRCHSSKLFALANIVNVKDLFNNLAILFMKKYQNRQLPDVFDNHLGRIALPDEVRSNYQYTMKIPKQHKKGHLFYAVITAWNSSSPEIREPAKIAQTKRLLKKISLQKMEANVCTTKKCFNCSLDQHRDYTKYMRK